MSESKLERVKKQIEVQVHGEGDPCLAYINSDNARLLIEAVEAAREFRGMAGTTLTLDKKEAAMKHLDATLEALDAEAE